MDLLVSSSLILSNSTCLLNRSTKLIFDSNSNPDMSLLFSFEIVLYDLRFFSSIPVAIGWMNLFPIFFRKILKVMFFPDYGSNLYSAENNIGFFSTETSFQKGIKAAYSNFD